jgi:hypothetical protein
LKTQQDNRRRKFKRCLGNLLAHASTAHRHKMKAANTAINGQRPENVAATLSLSVRRTLRMSHITKAKQMKKMAAYVAKMSICADSR